jgi:hypothetical protein
MSIGQCTLEELGVVTRTASWMFTLCNCTEEDEQRVQNLFQAQDKKNGKDLVLRGVVGREVAPTTGMRHLQRFLHLSRRMTRTKVVGMLGGHAWVGAMKGTEWQC